ncbi:Myb-like DNA-binding domain containing protein [Tritrichomonas foetus]|uniref:Myb-like DNA-binding domain containing protein n=1 Tax=Tritrichomonas foetus TaxID=1144522 RepID=A0A1J4KVZ1_9EUKA|nr:Myb-like DNA-binding domain containing protein [Tritrichomonas foetus]|eukprot:OHT15399.1 Myb-like DNA-binding domain containing protein [Tritrichomonas foetus]
MKKKKARENENRIQIMCHTCDRVIHEYRYAKCAICHNLIQCLECLSIGKEIENHYYSHPFIIIDRDSDPIYTVDWDSQEEINLLCLIKLLGLGNWNDISERMDYRSAAECEQHYYELFMHSPSAPFPEDYICEPLPKPEPPPFSTKPVESDPIEGSASDLMKKNKRRKTTLAEINGYMPHRHEFEEIYHKEAELLIAGLSFDPIKETDDSFLMKIQNLICYNSQLSERVHRTKVIEDWDYEHLELPDGPDPDFSIRRLNGVSEEEKAIDHAILPLGQYYGVNNTINFANILHKRSKLERNIMSRGFCIENGIRSYEEYRLFLRLKEYIHQGKIVNVEGWNKEIAMFTGSVSNNDEFKMLSKKEKDLCISNKIDPPLYNVIKELIFREYEIRKRLSKEEVFQMCDSFHREISLIYDLFESIGWISS